MSLPTEAPKPPMPARAITRLLALPTPAHLALVIVVTLVKYGVDRYPSIDLMRALSANWADPPCLAASPASR